MKNKIKIKFRKLFKDAIPPSRSDYGVRAYDIYAWMPIAFKDTDIREEIIIMPGERKIIHTGLNVRIPFGWELQVRPRSGNAFKHGISIVNTPGTIDSSFDGDGKDFELMVCLINHDLYNSFIVHHGDRIAQVVAACPPEIEWEEDFCNNINRPTKSRSGGFGSSGK